MELFNPWKLNNSPRLWSRFPRRVPGKWEGELGEEFGIEKKQIQQVEYRRNDGKEMRRF